MDNEITTALLAGGGIVGLLGAIGALLNSKFFATWLDGRITVKQSEINGRFQRFDEVMKETKDQLLTVRSQLEIAYVKIETLSAEGASAKATQALLEKRVAELEGEKGRLTADLASLHAENATLRETLQRRGGLS